MNFAPVPCAVCGEEVECSFPDDTTDAELVLMVADLRCQGCYDGIDDL